MGLGGSRGAATNPLHAAPRAKAIAELCQRMAELFPGDPLPDIFTPPSQVQGSRALLPIEVRVHYGMAPLLALIAAAVLVFIKALRPDTRVVLWWN